MGITATIIDDTPQQMDGIYEKIIRSFIMAGETFVKNAREQVQDHAMGTYLDDTTNLRNSIGYFIFHDGKLLHENNEIVTNKALVEDIVDPSGFQLIVLAGMNYASYVESKGYNVISYQADVCFVDLAGYLENLDLIEKGTAGRLEEGFTPDDLPGGLM